MAYIETKIYRKSVINYNVKSTRARNQNLDLISYHITDLVFLGNFLAIVEHTEIILVWQVAKLCRRD